MSSKQDSLLLSEEDLPGAAFQQPGPADPPAARGAAADIAKLAAKLATITRGLGPVPKKGWNKHFQYKFIRAADVVNALREKLAAQKIILLADVLLTERYEVELKSGKQQGQDVMVRYTLLDGESGASLSFRGAGSGLDSGDKAIYKALTGAEKYALTTIFLIADDSIEPESDGPNPGRERERPGRAEQGQGPAAQPQAAPAEVPDCSQGHGPMIWKFPNPKAANQWTPFWGCRKFPNCAERIYPQQAPEPGAQQ